MAKNFTIDYATGELDMGADTLREKFDLDEVTFRQPNLGQRYNLGGVVRAGFSEGSSFLDSMKIRYNLGDETITQLNTLWEKNKNLKSIHTFPNKAKDTIIADRLTDFASDFKEIMNRLPTANEIKDFKASSVTTTSTNKAKFLKDGVNFMEEADWMKKIKRIDQVTPDSPQVKKAFELYDKGWKKINIAEELGIDRTHLRKWFHKFRPEDIGDINKPAGQKYNYKAVRAQRIRELKSLLKKMPGGEKTLAQTIKVMDQIWDKNDEILKMTDDEIWNNKKFRDAMSLDVTGLKKGKGINFNRYADLSKEEFAAKVKAMAKNKEFFQPEHIIPISSKRTASLFPKNIQVAIGKTGSQMEVLKNFILNNPDDARIKNINHFLKNQDLQIGKLGFNKPIVVSSKTGKSNIVEAALSWKPVAKKAAKTGIKKAIGTALGTTFGLANEAFGAPLGKTVTLPTKAGEWLGEIPLTLSGAVQDWDKLVDMGRSPAEKKYAGGGSVEPRVAYKDGSEKEPFKAKDQYQLFEDIAQVSSGYADKGALGKLGDIADWKNWLYYTSMLPGAAVNVAEIAAKLPFVGAELISELITKKPSKEIFMKALKDITPGAWKEKVGLASLDRAHEEKMKKWEMSHAPQAFKDMGELGLEVVSPWGYGIAGKAINKLKKALAPEKRKVFDQTVADALDTKGMSRRQFNTLVVSGGTIAALKALGLDKVFKGVPSVKVADVTKIERIGDGQPTYLNDLIAVVRAKGERSTVPGYKGSDYSTKHTYKDIEVIEDPVGNIRVRRNIEGGGQYTDEFGEVETWDGTVKELEMEIKKDPEQPNASSYEEATARPDQDGSMEDVEFLIDDADHLELKEIADEINDLIGDAASFATGGRVSAQPPKRGPLDQGLPSVAPGVIYNEWIK